LILKKKSKIALVKVK